MKFLSVKQLCDRYSTSRQSIWRWVRDGRMPAPVKLSPGCTRWKLADLEVWEQSQGAQS
jgi:prophage regulatory protein